MYDTLLRAQANSPRRLHLGAIDYGRAGYVRGGTIPLSVYEWGEIPDNPLQRNTEERAPGATHLKVFEPKHAEVEMAILPDGTRYKLDGHTRLFMWRNGLTEGVPEDLILTVTVYECRDMTAVRKLYTRFDNKVAAETAIDRLTGAVKANDIQFTSSFMQSRRYTLALQDLYSDAIGKPVEGWNVATSMCEAVATFKEELLLLDQVEPNARFTSGIVRAALTTFLIHGKRALPFWRSFAKSEMTVDGDKKDGLAALHDALQSETKRRRRDKSALLYRKGVTAFDYWRRGKFYSARQGTKGLSDQTIAGMIETAMKTSKARG